MDLSIRDQYSYENRSESKNNGMSRLQSFYGGKFFETFNGM